MPVMFSFPSYHRPRIQPLPRPTTGPGFYTHQHLSASEYIPFSAGLWVRANQFGLWREGVPCPRTGQHQRSGWIEGSLLLQGDYIALKWVSLLDYISPPYPAPSWIFPASTGTVSCGHWGGPSPPPGAMKLPEDVGPSRWSCLVACDTDLPGPVLLNFYCSSTVCPIECLVSW